jgi:uridine phosphorylase
MGEDPRYHIRVQPGAVGGYVLLPGDRDRVERIARHLERPRPVAENREYRTITGELDGELVSVMSSGMGCPAVAIAVEELRTAGVHTIIRVGTTGAVGPGPHRGDAVIAQAALRSDGTSNTYIEPGYPAVADFAVTDALRRAAIRAGHPYHLGLVQSSDAYYAASWWGEKVAHDRLDLLRRAGVVSVEMEASTLFVVGRLRGLRTGCILAMREEWGGDGTRHQAGEAFEKGLDQVIAIAVDAVRLLIQESRPDDTLPVKSRPHESRRQETRQKGGRS